MRRFMRPMKVPGPPVHPLVIGIIKEANRQRIGPRDLAARAGVGHSTIQTWRMRKPSRAVSANSDKVGPMLLTVEALGNALGLELVWQKRKD